MIKKLNKGFTLIELLVVIGILAILLSITLIAINPARQFGNANDTKRRSNVTQILNAIGAFQAENQGQLPDSVKALPTDTPNDIAATPMASLCADLVPNYIPALPTDPGLNAQDIEAADCASNWNTGYKITKDAQNRLTISATGDVTTNISVSR